MDRGTRTKLGERAKRKARDFIDDPKGKEPHHFVPANEPVIIGFSRTDASVLSFRNDEALPPPKIQLNPQGAPAGTQWLTATSVLGSWAAYRWEAPQMRTEMLILKAVLRTDMQPSDLKFLERRVAVLHVVAATEVSMSLAGRVVAEVGRDHAIDGIRLARWLRVQLGDGSEKLAAWLADHHPANGAAKAERGTSALLAGSGYEEREWYDLERILRGAYRFVHPVPNRSRPKRH